MKLPILTAGSDTLFRQLFALNEKVVIVTGGGSGIGRAACKLFAAAGATVAAFDLDEAGGNETVRLIDGMNAAGRCVFHKVNVTNVEMCRTGISDLVSRGVAAPTILFNCAGISRRDADMDPAGRDLQWAVNVDGVKNMTEAVAPRMTAEGWGRIINMGSVVGFRHIAFPLGSHYKSTKEEVHAYTAKQGLALGPFGITVNALAPGRVLTDLVLKPGFGWAAKAPDPVEAFRAGCATQRSGRMLYPEEVAAAAFYLCSPMLQMVNATVLDLSDGWASGHTPWGKDEMPAAFVPFRDEAQLGTPTRIVPV